VTPFTTGRYVRRHRIATGGMGEVWLAHDEVLHRDVAVKYLKREYADDDAFHARFLQEARTAASLHHPGIATVFDFGESEAEEGLPYLVMEYVDGRTLGQLLAEGALDPERARNLILQAASALAEAHSRGLVHRDLKPGNLMVTADDVVKITDFGIARAADGSALTETGQLLGTPSYISPEQAEGLTATPASDVYALGVVLFECLTGERPYRGDTPVAIALAHLREPVPDLPHEVPAGLAAVTRQALAKDPAERYPHAGALAAALAALDAEPTLLMTAPVAAAPAPGTALADALRERRPLVVVAALGVVFAIVLVVAALSPDGGGTDATSASGSPTPSPSVSTNVALVQVDPAAYVGKPRTTVEAALKGLGLRTRVDTVANPGGHAAGTVKALSPTGAMAVGTLVTLDVWGAPPAPKTTATKGHGKPGPGKPHKGKGKHR
jgi:serine/threonine-protein kinase